MAYVVDRGDVFYAVIHEGTSPVTGRERRRWHRYDSRAAAV